MKHVHYGLHYPETLSVIAVFVSIALLCMFMGRRKSYDPRDYRGIDVENAPDDVPVSSSSSEDSSGTRHRSRRRRTGSQSQSEQVPEEPIFWVVCPCRSCERHEKSHSRLYSTVRRHLRQHLMGVKFKVIYYFLLVF